MDEQQGDKVYTLAGAAAAAGVSLPTIRRKREDLVAAGAVIGSKRWEIPHSALVAAGFNPSWTTDDVGKPQEPQGEPVEAEPLPEPTNELRVAQDRIRRLESENLVLRGQVDKWEIVARERLDALNDQRLAFRALAMTQPRELEPPKPAEEAPEQPPRQSWWKRNFG